MLPRGGEIQRGSIKQRATDHDGKPMGVRSSNPILDTRQYEVEFLDGSTEIYNANILAENIYSQVDEEGRQMQLLDEIIDHRSDGTALNHSNGYYMDRGGNQRPKMTTKGWELEVHWKDGSMGWVKLKDLKESFPVQVAQYAKENNLISIPAFKWWVHKVLRKKERILAKVKSRYWAKTHKFGVRLPKTIKQALRFDSEDGTDHWRQAIEREMKSVKVAFQFIDDDMQPVGHKKIRLHWIFDVKMVTLQRKARLVANGNETDPPKDTTFSSVVSRESVRIFFLLAALNDVEVLSADIQNAYLIAGTKEKLWAVADEAFGSEVGRPMIIVRALYGLKTSGARFRDHLAGTLRSLGFVGSRADPDVWLKPGTKNDGTKYYEYVLCYVDDILCSSEDPGRVMHAISGSYQLKEG